MNNEKVSLLDTQNWPPNRRGLDGDAWWTLFDCYGTVVHLTTVVGTSWNGRKLKRLVVKRGPPLESEQPPLPLCVERFTFFHALEREREKKLRPWESAFQFFDRILRDGWMDPPVPSDGSSHRCEKRISSMRNEDNENENSNCEWWVIIVEKLIFAPLEIIRN